MSISWSIPRNCLAWILLAQLLLIAPHVERLPWWVLVAYVACAVWRIMVYRGQWSEPPRATKFLLVLLCLIGTFVSYGTLMGLEPTVAMLFTGLCLKLLEIATRRDVYALIFLAYFAALTEFLFLQDFSIAILIFVTVLVITTAMTALHQHHYQQWTQDSLKKASLMMLQALPLMLVLFLVFPRFSPLWEVPLPSHQAKTGISDTMSPGDISSLSQSGELAFRVTFSGEIPAKQAMYWRGLVMSQFDGRTWRQGRLPKAILKDDEAVLLRRQLKNPIRYEVIQEPSYQPWIFTLALAWSDDSNTRIVNDYRLVHAGDIASRIKFDVLSDPDAVIEKDLPSYIRTFETALPDNINPQSRQFAKSLYQQSHSHLNFIQRVLQHFRNEAFFYTLKPPLLGEEVVDDFLFNTRRGFCGHYASSFVFLMRAVGIPARVVNGYQGGEVSPITGTVLVHQFDAHSWAEVWLEGKGWVRFDPTAAVAPNRIEFGLEQAMQEEGSFLSDVPLSPLRYRDVAWLNKLRLRLDAFDYYWASWVLQYKDERQSRVLKQLLGEVSPWRIALLLMGVGSLVFALVAWQLLKNSQGAQVSAEEKLYLKLCRRLARLGYPRQTGEGPTDYARRVAEQQPNLKPSINAATRAFITLNYQSVGAEQRKSLLKLLRFEIARVPKRI